MERRAGRYSGLLLVALVAALPGCGGGGGGGGYGSPGEPNPAGAASNAILFATGGQFAYRCNIHPSMVGTVTVR